MDNESDRSNQLRNHIVAFINTPSWDKAEDYLTDHAEFLLTEEIDPIFEEIFFVYQDNPEMDKVLRTYHAILTECRTHGIAAVFEELYDQQIAALLGGTNFSDEEDEEEDDDDDEWDDDDEDDEWDEDDEEEADSLLGMPVQAIAGFIFGAIGMHSDPDGLLMRFIMSETEEESAELVQNNPELLNNEFDEIIEMVNYFLDTEMAEEETTPALREYIAGRHQLLRRLRGDATP